MERKNRLKVKKRNNNKNFLSAKMFFVKIIFLFLFFITVFGGFFFGVRYFLLNSPFFEIKEVTIDRDWKYFSKENLKKLEHSYAGRNIFSIDLKTAQKLTEKEFPHLKKVELTRVFPGRLVFHITGREPIAAIETGTDNLIIDADGVVIAVVKDIEGLLKIKGVTFFLNRFSIGRKIESNIVKEAIVLAKDLQKVFGTNMKGIEYVDISDRRNILIGFHGVEVKIGTGGFARKIDMLEEIWKDPNMDMRKINYIDLRFEDAVISVK